MAPRIIIGVDEAGRGALAGPLVVCAAAFQVDTPVVTAMYKSLRGEKVVVAGDSKSFSNPLHREVLDPVIRESAMAVAVIERSAKEIDERLMYVVFPEALRLAIARVIERLVQLGHGDVANDYVVKIDGEIPRPEGIPCVVHSIPDGDKKIWQIGAASIVAKVHRDHRMDELHAAYPEWGFDTHRGYPTPAHKKLIKTLELTPIHRRTFRPVAEAKGLPPGFEM
jgi:ribonuclease HII